MRGAIETASQIFGLQASGLLSMRKGAVVPMEAPGRRPVLNGSGLFRHGAVAGAWLGALAGTVIHALAPTRLPGLKRPITNSMLLGCPPRRPARETQAALMTFRRPVRAPISSKAPAAKPCRLRPSPSDRLTVLASRARTAGYARNSPPKAMPASCMMTPAGIVRPTLRRTLQAAAAWR